MSARYQFGFALVFIVLSLPDILPCLNDFCQTWKCSCCFSELLARMCLMHSSCSSQSLTRTKQCVIFFSCIIPTNGKLSVHAGRSAQLHRVTPSLSPSSVRVCSHSFPQNSPLEVDDEGFVIRADSTQNDILLLLLHSGPGKTIKEYFCFEPVIKNNRGSRCVANKEDATEKPQCSRNCFEMS